MGGSTNFSHVLPLKESLYTFRYRVCCSNVVVWTATVHKSTHCHQPAAGWLAEWTSYAPMKDIKDLSWRFEHERLAPVPADLHAAPPKLLQIFDRMQKQLQLSCAWRWMYNSPWWVPWRQLSTLFSSANWLGVDPRLSPTLVIRIDPSTIQWTFGSKSNLRHQCSDTT